MNRKFNVRVYGICINEQNELLVADELIKGREITKFPGGGLEFGEGTVECVKREFMEETGQEVEVINHFYTTDFFVASAFNPESQVISIYYLVRFKEQVKFTTSSEPFDFPERKEGAWVFRWIPLNKISENDFTFVIDQKVARLLKEKNSQ